jgi:Helix-turn-helix domain
MSVHVSSWVWDYADAEGNELLILLALADYANDEGVCWPGMKAVSKRCRCSTRTVQRSIENAVDQGVLTVRARMKSNGVPDTHLYQFIKYLEHRVGDKLSTRVGDKLTGGSGQIDRGVGDIAMSTKPSIEPSYKNGTERQSAADNEFDFARASSSSRERPSPNPSQNLAVKPIREKLLAFCQSIDLTPDDADAIDDFWLMKGFVTGKTPIKNWPACIRTYKRQGWLPSMKPRNGNGKNGHNEENTRGY